MDIRTAILDAAEARIRTAGFHGFSFRDVALDVGIKSASVHYHFPTKSSLGEATAERYLEKFLDHLGAAADSRSLPAKLERMRQLFRYALITEGKMCLCGALGAEIVSLPEPVAKRTRQFFVECRQWLTVAFRKARVSKPNRHAMRVLATLEGALLISRTLDDIAAFDDATAALE